MPAGHKTPPQRILLLGVLIVGAIIFALPYVNMVSTSIKTDDELGAVHFSLLPHVPIPRSKSPYVMADNDYEISRPADMDRKTWDDFKDPFTAAVRQAVDNWWTHQPVIASAFATVDRAAAVDSLTRIVGAGVLARISDKARKLGPAAMLAEVPSLASPDKIKNAFVEFLPRFTLSDVSVRLSEDPGHPSDYSRKRLAGSGQNWQVTSKNASLIPLVPPAAKVGQNASLLNYDSPDRSPITAVLIPPTSAPAAATALSPGQFPPLAVGEIPQIDRIYLFLQADQSWSRIDLLITLAGRQYRLAESLYAANRTWTEIEVRIPGHENSPISGRNFFLLDDAGPAPADAPQFSVALILHPNTAAGAWWAKISRNYFIAFRQVPIARYFCTSLSLAILTILLTVFGSSLSAYAFARLDFPGRNVLFAMLLATMMIPGQVVMIPNFLIQKSLGWYNTLYPLWVHAAFGSAFFIFMMRQFFLSIPKELEDAARIDGCGFFGIYWHIMLPLIRPTLITVAIFAFMGSWNNFMGPLIYLNDERLYNLAFGLYKFQLTSGTNSSLIMAGAFVMTLPIIAMFFLFQRYFIRGIALSGLGGR